MIVQRGFEKDCWEKPAYACFSFFVETDYKVIQIGTIVDWTG